MGGFGDGGVGIMGREHCSGYISLPFYTCKEQAKATFHNSLWDQC